MVIATNYKYEPGERKGVPLEVGDLGAAQEDVLASASNRLLLLNLDLHNVRRVLDDLGDVGAVAGADFTKDTLVDPNDTTDKPVALHQPVRRRPFRLCRSAERLTQKTPMVLYEQ